MSNYTEEIKDITVTKLAGNAYRFDGTRYQLNSLESLINLVKTKGTEQQTVIFYSDNEIQIILDDSEMERNQDKAFYSFKTSDLFAEWLSIFGANLSQKKFIDFLKVREGELQELETLLAAAKNLTVATQINGDYIYDDNNNMTVMFKIQDAETKAKLPTLLHIRLPILNESTFISELELELELTKPKADNERPTFKITCNKYSRYYKEAIAVEIEKLKAALPDHLIMAGKIS